MLTIADRRAVMAAAMTQPDFRDLLRDDPAAAVARVTHQTMPDGLRLRVIEEAPEAWEFILPGAPIDVDLPAPDDVRSLVENGVYALLRDEPAARDEAVRDPKEFLAQRLNLTVGSDAITVHEEKPGELILVLPHLETREGLGDELLDMVSGGGDAGCQSGQRSAERDKIYG